MSDTKAIERTLVAEGRNLHIAGSAPGEDNHIAVARSAEAAADIAGHYNGVAPRREEIFALNREVVAALAQRDALAVALRRSNDVIQRYRADGVLTSNEMREQLLDFVNTNAVLLRSVESPINHQRDQGSE